MFLNSMIILEKKPCMMGEELNFKPSGAFITSFMLKLQLIEECYQVAY